MYVDLHLSERPGFSPDVYSNDSAVTVKSSKPYCVVFMHWNCICISMITSCYKVKENCTKIVCQCNFFCWKLIIFDSDLSMGMTKNKFNEFSFKNILVLYIYNLSLKNVFHFLGLLFWKTRWPSSFLRFFVILWFYGCLLSLIYRETQTGCFQNSETVLLDEHWDRYVADSWAYSKNGGPYTCTFM